MQIDPAFNRQRWSSNCFDRPVADTIKLAVVFDSVSGSVTAKILDKATPFAETLAGAQVVAFTQDDPVLSGAWTAAFSSLDKREMIVRRISDPETGEGGALLSIFFFFFFFLLLPGLSSVKYGAWRTYYKNFMLG